MNIAYLVSLLAVSSKVNKRYTTRQFTIGSWEFRAVSLWHRRLYVQFQIFPGNLFRISGAVTALKSM